MTRFIRRAVRAASGALMGLVGIAATASTAGPGAVDLELVLAVDTSSSVSYDEFQLQMFGLADAFRDTAVVNAIHAAAPAGVVVTLVQWAGKDQQVQAVDWIVVHDAASAAAFAAHIDGTPRLLTGGATAIGSVMAFAAGLLEDNGFDGVRRAIDVSGDGTSNQGLSPLAVRAHAVAAGITVNGLAILNEEPYLDAYYLAAVVGGDGSFALTADDYDDFARAIRLKLILEISGTPLAGAPRPPPHAIASDFETTPTAAADGHHKATITPY